MSKVTLKYSNRKHIVSCEGHNENARVCAGLSAILQGLLWYLEKWGEDYIFEEHDGYLRIEFGDNFQCTTIYRFIESSIEGIALEYPELISLELGTH